MTFDCWDCMQRISPLAITAQAGGHFTLWTLRDNMLRKCWRRSVMIYCRGVTEGGDQGWSGADVILCEVEISRRGELRNDWEHQSYLDGSILEANSSFWNGSGVTEAFSCLDTWRHPVMIKFWSLHSPTSILIFLCIEEQKKWRSTKGVKIQILRTSQFMESNVNTMQ